MLVTLSGMVMEVKPLQPEKARSPMLVTLSGMVTEVREVQYAKAPLPNPVRTPYKIADQINGNLDLIF